MTAPEPTSYFALLEKRLDIMRRLAGALEAGKTALLEGDAESIVAHAEGQQRLCRQWAELEDALRQERRQMGWPAAGNECALPVGDVGRWTALRESLQEVETRVRRLQRVHAALLRRMRRSIAIMANLLDAGQATYAPPAPVCDSAAIRRD